MERTIDFLLHNKQKVYVVCRTNCVARKFLKDAYQEGYSFKGMKCEDCIPSDIYAITQKEICHVSGATHMYFDTELVPYDKIDYLKYICEEKDYFYHSCDKKEIIMIGNTEDVLFQCMDLDCKVLKVSDENHHIIDLWINDGKEHVIKGLNVAQNYLFECDHSSVTYKVKSKLELKQKVILNS